MPDPSTSEPTIRKVERVNIWDSKPVKRLPDLLSKEIEATGVASAG